MKLHNTLTHNRGFTLIEILVVLGIFTVIASIGLSFSFDSYRGHLFRSEYTNVIHMIAKARNRSASNFNESSHVFEITATEYKIYPSSSPSDAEVFTRNLAFTVADGTYEFEQLSGQSIDCDPGPCTLTFGYGGKTKTININKLGGITW